MAALLTLALVVAGMAGLFPAAARAQSTPLTLTVVSQSVILNDWRDHGGGADHAGRQQQPQG
jgi:hypothetical protein